MPLKSYADQIAEHSKFLASHGFEIDQLMITGQFVRCRRVGQMDGRGELSYKTTQSKLNNGCIGLMTWCRGISGVAQTFKTYGLGPDGSESYKIRCEATLPIDQYASHEQVAKRAFGFWKHSNITGQSDYLERKGVGAYGVRFRESEKYGRVLVVPMFDVQGKLWNYQLINPDGSKRDARGGRTEGLFHFLRPLVNGQTIGIAESYSTAATCMEITGIACICCFGCNNIKPVIVALADKYLDSRLIIFADNDRHLPNGNQGVLKAQEAHKINPGRIAMAVPEFGDSIQSKEASDWNDLVRLKGRSEVSSQLELLRVK